MIRFLLAAFCLLPTAFCFAQGGQATALRVDPATKVHRAALYSGATPAAQIAACLAGVQAQGGGTCDASAVPILTPITTQIFVGITTPVLLIFNAQQPIASTVFVPNNVTIWNSGGSSTYSPGGIQMATGMPPDALNNDVAWSLSRKYSYTTPGQPDAQGIFINSSITGDLTNRSPSAVNGGHDAIFAFGGVRDISHAPAYYFSSAIHGEGYAMGTGADLPFFKLTSGFYQSWILDSGPGDTIVIPTVIDVWGVGPYRASRCTARNGYVSLTYNSTAVTGTVAGQFVAGDVGKKLFAGFYTHGLLDNAEYGGVIASVPGDGTNATLVAGWTHGDRSEVAWTTQAAPATGACGGTSDIQYAFSGQFMTPWVGSSWNSALDIGHFRLEDPLQLSYSVAGSPKWTVGTATNPLVQSHDFVIYQTANLIPFLRAISLSGGNAPLYLNSSGTSPIYLNAYVGGAGEAGATGIGSGGLVIGSGGAAPVTYSGTIKFGGGSSVADFCLSSSSAVALCANSTEIKVMTNDGSNTTRHVFYPDGSGYLAYPNIAWDAGGNLTTVAQFRSTVATGTAPLTVASTTQVANLMASNSAALAGATWASSAAIGSAVPAAGAFTNLTVGTSAGHHLNTAGAGTDVANVLLVTAGNTTGSVNFTTAWNYAPICTVTPTVDPGGRYWYSVSTTAITVAMQTAPGGTAYFGFHCMGTPN